MTTALTGISTEEAQARVELAALYRLVERQGWGEGIYNHISLRVPGEPDKFLIKPHALTYEEVRASDLVKVDCRGDIDETDGVNKVGFNTHAPVMRGRPDINCAVHIHTLPVMAMAANPRGLRMLHAQTLTFYGKVAYQDFTGVAERPDDQQRIIEDLGASNTVIVFRNHGVLLTSTSAEGVFAACLRFIASCQIQLAAEAAGDAVDIPEEICRTAAVQLAHHDKGRGGADWPAWLRRLDRLDPSYRD